MRKLNGVHLSGNLSGLTITCADGTRRFIKYATVAQNGVETSQATIHGNESPTHDAEISSREYCQCPQRYRNTLSGRNSQRFSQSNSELENSVNSSTPHRYSRISYDDRSEQLPYNIQETKNERDLDTNVSCDENTYATLLDRFNLMKERMSRSPKRGDKLLEKDSCTILEEESRKMGPLSLKSREHQNISDCSQSTERMTTTKVNAASSGYLKEMFVERSTFTKQGIMTTTKHIMEKCDKNDIVDYKVKDLNGRGERGPNTKQKNIDLLESGIHPPTTSYTPRQSSCIGKCKNDGDIKLRKDSNRQSYTNSIVSNRSNRVETKQQNSNGKLYSQNDLGTLDSGICTEHTDISERSQKAKNNINQKDLETIVPSEKSRQSRMSTKNNSRSQKKFGASYSGDSLSVRRNSLRQGRSALPYTQQTNPSKWSQFRQGSAQRMFTPEEQIILQSRQMSPQSGTSIINQNNSPPIIENSKEYCSCIRQLCERHITQLLSLPENGLDPEMLSKLLIQDSEGRMRIDYFLVGELLRNQSVGVFNVGKDTEEGLNGISPAENRESQSILLGQNDSGRVYRSEELEDVPRSSYQTSIQSSIADLPYNQNSRSSSLNDISLQNSEEIFFGEEALYTSCPSLPRTAENVPGESSKNSQLVAEIVVPNAFNCELLEGLDTYSFKQTPNVTDQYTDEEIIEILPPTHKTSSNEILPVKFDEIEPVFVQTSVHSVQRNGIANESGVLNSTAKVLHRSNLFSNKELQNDIELPGWQEEQCKDGSDSELDFDDERPAYNMEPRTNYATTNNSLEPEENKSLPFKSDKRNSKRERCSEYVNGMVPVIFDDPQLLQTSACECCEVQKSCPLPRANQECEIKPTGIPNIVPLSMESCNSQDDEENLNQLSNRKSIDSKRRHRYSSGQDRCGCCDQEAQNFCSIIEGYCQKKFSNDVCPHERSGTLSETDDQRNCTEDFKNTSGTRSKKSRLLKEVIISNDFGCCAPTCIDKGIQVYCCEIDTSECSPCTDNQVRNNIQEFNDRPRVSHDQYNSGRIGRKSNDEKCSQTVESSYRSNQQRNSSFEPRISSDQNCMNRTPQREQLQNNCDEVLIKIVASSDKNCGCEDQQQQSTSRSPRVSFDQNDNTCVLNDQYQDISDEFRNNTTETCRDEQPQNTSDGFCGQFGLNSSQTNKQDSSSNDNTGHNQQTIQPIVIPIMCYLQLPPSICRVCYPYQNTQSCCSVNVPNCNYQCCSPNPAINSSYPCQCCEPQSCYTHQICSCEVQSCDPSTSTCFPYQCCDQPCCSMSQLQYCCPPLPSVGTTSFTCCDPQACCCMPCCDPQQKLLTLQIGQSTHGDNYSRRSHGKKSRDRKRSCE